MTHSTSSRICIQHEEAAQPSALSIVAHGSGWAVKYKDSYLGALVTLADALMVMATLSDHVAQGGRP
jgi:hypothetical protein